MLIRLLALSFAVEHDLVANAQALKHLNQAIKTERPSTTGVKVKPPSTSFHTPRFPSTVRIAALEMVGAAGNSPSCTVTSANSPNGGSGTGGALKTIFARVFSHGIGARLDAQYVSRHSLRSP
jgi:hypothetical protein